MRPPHDGAYGLGPVAGEDSRSRGSGGRFCELASAAFFRLLWLRGGDLARVVRGMDEFCRRSANDAGLHVAELHRCLRRIFISARDTEYGDRRGWDSGGGFVLQCSLSLAAASDRCAVPGVMDHLDSGGGDRAGVFKGDGLGDAVESEDRTDQQVLDVPVWIEPGAAGDR